MQSSGKIVLYYTQSRAEHVPHPLSDLTQIGVDFIDCFKFFKRFSNMPVTCL